MDEERKSELKAVLIEAYNTLEATVQNYSTRSRIVYEAKIAYERAKSAVYTGGKIVGSNETQRKACEVAALEREIKAIAAAEGDEDAAKLAYTLAKYEVEKVTWIIRIETGDPK